MVYATRCYKLEIKAMRMMGPAENIKDARAVVNTVAKTVGGQTLKT